MNAIFSDDRRSEEVVSPSKDERCKFLQLFPRVRGAKSPARCLVLIFDKSKVGSQGESCFALINMNKSDDEVKKIYT